MKNFNQITLIHRRSAPQASNDEWLARRRRQLMAIHPDADPNDIEFELALERDDLRTKGEEK